MKHRPDCTRSRGTRLGILLALLGASLPLAPAHAGGPPDRLDRFRELIATRVSLAQLVDADAAAGAYREIYALLDEEIVENLSSGGVFASIPFLQDRVDAFAGAWGGATLRVVPIGPLVIGAFALSGGASVRVYGRLRGEPALLALLARPGRPTVYPLPPERDGAPQFLVAWDGAPSGRGTRALRIDLVRGHGDGVRVAWSTADVLSEGLLARAYSVRGAEVQIRYEVQYPGWTPGCEGQTEDEDVFRFDPAAGTFVRARRSQHNPWHRSLHASVARLFELLATGDRGGLASLIRDPELRGRLPAGLRPEPACDAADGANPHRVSVAATAERGPWQLTWERAGARWRLTGAAPVIE